MNKVAGVILMGGLNTRMDGEKKAFLDFRGKEFYKHILNALSSLDKIYFSVEDLEKYSGLEYELIEDIYKEIGPVGGIFSSLSKCSEDAIFVLPSDTPLMKRELIDTMLKVYYEKDMSIVLNENGKDHPLIAIYKREILEVLEENISLKKYSVLDTLKKINYVSVYLEDIEVDKYTIKDCNDKESYKKLIDKDFL